MGDRTYWECQYCLKRFVRETSFMRHECSEMKKAELIKTPEGLAAYDYYSQWLKFQKRKAPTIETFATSRYFNTFIKFDEFVKKYKIPKPEKFIELMIKNGNISPMLWCRDAFYSLYLEWYDRTVTPLDQAEVTIENLNRLIEIHSVNNAEELFKKLHYRELIELIRHRKISPWILLCSTVFREILQNMPREERVELGLIMGTNYYAEKFEKDPILVSQMKQIAQALNI